MQMAKLLSHSLYAGTRERVQTVCLPVVFEEAEGITPSVDEGCRTDVTMSD